MNLEITSMSARRGRPKSEPRPAIDLGTDELRAKRLMIAKGGDPALASYPLGILLARHVIDADQHQAGCNYAWLYGKAVDRHTQVVAWAMEPAWGSHMSEEREVAIRQAYLSTRAVLTRLGALTANIVDDVAIFGHAPRWIGEPAFRLFTWAEKQHLLLGLTELARYLLNSKRPAKNRVAIRN